jgi:hypothetical protein
MEPEASLTCSQQLTTGPYPDPDECSWCQPITFLLRSILILSYLCLGLLVVSFLEAFLPKPCVQSSPLPSLHMLATCSAHHIVLDLVIPIVFGKSKSYETPQYVVFSSLWLFHPGFDIQQGQDFSPLHSIQTNSGAHPASCSIGTGGISPGVKQLGHEADYSPPSSAEVKNGGAIPPFPICLHGIVLPSN